MLPWREGHTSVLPWLARRHAIGVWLAIGGAVLQLMIIWRRWGTCHNKTGALGEQCNMPCQALNTAGSVAMHYGTMISGCACALMAAMLKHGTRASYLCLSLQE